MAFKVTMDAPELTVVHADYFFLVKQDNSVLGKLAVSKGGVEWFPKGKSVKTKKFNWKKFAKLLEAQ